MNDVLTKVLEQLFNKTGRKHDVYYTEGFGARFVNEGMPESNMPVLTLDEHTLQMMLHTGREIDIHVGQAH